MDCKYFPEPSWTYRGMCAKVCKSLWVDTGTGPLRDSERLRQRDGRKMEMSHGKPAGGQRLQAADCRAAGSLV